MGNKRLQKRIQRSLKQSLEEVNSYFNDLKTRLLGNSNIQVNLCVYKKTAKCCLQKDILSTPSRKTCNKEKIAKGVPACTRESGNALHGQRICKNDESTQKNHVDGRENYSTKQIMYNYLTNVRPTLATYRIDKAAKDVNNSLNSFEERNKNKENMGVTSNAYYIDRSKLPHLGSSDEVRLIPSQATTFTKDGLSCTQSAENNRTVDHPRQLIFPSSPIRKANDASSTDAGHHTRVLVKESTTQAHLADVIVQGALPSREVLYYDFNLTTEMGSIIENTTAIVEDSSEVNVTIDTPDSLGNSLIKEIKKFRKLPILCGSAENLDSSLFEESKCSKKSLLAERRHSHIPKAKRIIGDSTERVDALRIDKYKDVDKAKANKLANNCVSRDKKPTGIDNVSYDKTIGLAGSKIVAGRGVTSDDTGDVTSSSFKKLRKVTILGTPAAFSTKELDELLSLRTIPFAEMPLTVQKIGEATFSEVFIHNSNIYKIIPFSGSPDAMTKDEFNKEVMICKVLGNEPGVCGFLDAFYLYGKYTDNYLSAWDHYKNPENERPSKYKESQKYGVICLKYGGVDLEKYKFKSMNEVMSIVSELLELLVRLEKKYEFEHRDLHWGNILINHGKVTLIDFSLSRVRAKKIVYSDLDEKPWLFNVLEDFDVNGQYKVYKDMRKCTPSWLFFSPRTNVLWFRYIVSAIISKVRFPGKKNFLTNVTFECNDLQSLSFFDKKCISKQ